MNHGFSESSTSYASGCGLVTVITALVTAPGAKRTSVRAGATESAQARGDAMAMSHVAAPVAMYRARIVIFPLEREGLQDQLVRAVRRLRQSAREVRFGVEERMRVLREAAERGGVLCEVYAAR